MSEIDVTDAAGLRTIRIARPEKKNALTGAMYAAMAEALRGATSHAIGARGADHRRGGMLHLGQ